MKYIITLFALLFSCTVKAQKTNDSLTVFGSIGLIIGDISKPDYIIKWDEHTISVRGDTLKAIQNVINELEKVEKRQGDWIDKYYNLLITSVDFSNHVPDIWRTSEHNCAWPAYWRLLRKKDIRVLKQRSFKM
jgi:hypothetical protein